MRRSFNKHRMNLSENSGDQLIEEFIKVSSANIQTHPEFVISNFDEAIPDVSFNPFPAKIITGTSKDDDAFSEYSAISGGLSPNCMLANGDLFATTGFNSSATSSNSNTISHHTSANAQQPYLTVPTFRNRSPSVSSNHSYSSINFDSLKMSDNYGEKSPFPGSQVVQVPSSWIAAINSPTMSVRSDISVAPLDLPEPMDFSIPSNISDQVSFVKFEEYMANQNFTFDMGLGGCDMNNQTHSQVPKPPHNMSTMRGSTDTFATSKTNDQGMSDVSAKSIDLAVKEKPEKRKEPSTSVPTGKFWNVVKQNGNTLYQCPFDDCGKTFTRPYNLKSHYLAHTGERPYLCDEPGCESAFSRKHDLKRHSKLHSGEREYKCKACNKAFSRHDALVRHLKPVEGEKNSVCALNLDLEAKEKRIKRSSLD